MDPDATVSGSLLSLIATSPVASALKTSAYAYPIVNALHIMGLATLFGAILALDLRLLGAFRSVPAQPLAQVLPRVAAAGLCVAVTTGALLFSVNPFDYAANTAFLTKLVLVTAGALHAVAVHLSPGWTGVLAGAGRIGGGIRVSAAVSLLIWTSAILAGRFIAF
ncbi:MAG: DUF6644 family protein [Acetobacteraceae bacterium]